MELFERISELFKRNSFLTYIIVYIILLSVCYTGIWAFIEPFDMSSSINLIPNLISKRIFWHAIITMLLASYLYIIFLLLFQKRNFKVKYDNRQDQETLFGFYLCNLEDIREVNLDGGWKSSFRYRIIATSHEVCIIPHPIYLVGDVKFGKASISVQGESANSTIHHDIITANQQSINILVRFSPPLRPGQYADIEINSMFTSGFTMAFEDINEQVNKGVWPFTENIEFTTLDIRYPTRNITMKVIFPAGYNIYGKDYFDIYFPSSYQRIPAPYEHFQKNGTIEIIKSKDKTSLKLLDNNVTTGVRYCLKWIPPRSIEYKQLKSDSVAS